MAAPLLRILMIVTGLVLLLILANLASLMLARATTRGKELDNSTHNLARLLPVLHCQSLGGVS